MGFSCLKPFSCLVFTLSCFLKMNALLYFTLEHFPLCGRWLQHGMCLAHVTPTNKIICYIEDKHLSRFESV